MTDAQTAAPAIKPGSRKSNFSDTYDRPTPETYYRALHSLDYKTPELARPFIRRCLDMIRKTLRGRPVRVIDLCCGYGVNAALLNHDVDMDDLYDRYTDWPGPDLLPKAMIESSVIVGALLAVMRSRPAVGSSKIRICGVVTSARMMTVFCFMPEEKSSVRRSAKSFIRKSANTLSRFREISASSRSLSRPK